MTKLLLTDFFGTLIPGDAVLVDHLYGNHFNIFEQDYKFDMFGDDAEDKEKYAFRKMFLVTANYLSSFLKDGNRLVIITSADDHDPASFVYKQLISKLLNECLFKDQISVFFQISSKKGVISDLKTVANIYVRDGVMYGTDEDGFTFIIIQSKEQAFEFLDVNGKDIYAIGDDCPDFKMLSKCMQLGGKSSIINEFMLRPISVDEVIRESISRELRILRDQLIFEANPSLNDGCEYAKVIIEFNRTHMAFRRQFCSRKKIEYFEKLNNGTLNIMDEIRKNELYQKINRYNYSFIENLDDRLDAETWFNDIDMYPSFFSYSQQVLARKK